MERKAVMNKKPVKIVNGSLYMSSITKVAACIEEVSYIFSKTTLTLIVPLPVISSTVKILIQSSLLT
jgi:hypothetical protein